MRSVFMEIKAEDARKIIGKVGPKLGHDFTYSPIYPEERRDVCAVRHSSQDGLGSRLAASAIASQRSTLRKSSKASLSTNFSSISSAMLIYGKAS